MPGASLLDRADPGSLRSLPPGCTMVGCRICFRPGQHLLARAPTPRPGVGARLLASWSELHRRYHSIGHLRDILERRRAGRIRRRRDDAVRLAAWFPDSVYAGRPDDEELSARRAEHDLSRLGVAPQLVDEVARLVRLTVGHHPAG